MRSGVPIKPPLYLLHYCCLQPLNLIWMPCSMTFFIYKFLRTEFLSKNCLFFPTQPINPVLMQKFSKISVKYGYFSHRQRPECLLLSVARSAIASSGPKVDFFNKFGPKKNARNLKEIPQFLVGSILVFPIYFKSLLSTSLIVTSRASVARRTNFSE